VDIHKFMHTYATKRVRMNDNELKKIIVPYLLFGYNVHPDDISRILHMDRTNIYKIIQEIKKGKKIY